MLEHDGQKVADFLDNRRYKTDENINKCHPSDRVMVNGKVPVFVFVIVKENHRT